ncbi:hypothetical protein ACMD2_17620 [Ananas comosus]|uniref:FAR1 domain-containing protein n=1 Tax=Ananas comosus TaxID=4615 RepID=A0A199UPD6_ANACO|nr:hypothetical protein ACMD2_17620 [Ananas comosus]
MTYCCSKAGHSKPTSQDKSEHKKSQGSHTPKKDCPNRRTNCKAHVVLKINDRGKWVITVVANEHNHELMASPFKTHEFENAWATMIDKYQLHENNHVRLLWNIRYQ